MQLKAQLQAMNATYDELAGVLIEKKKSMEADGELGGKRKFWVAVAGPPGSGKTTLCDEVAQRVRDRGVQIAVLSMDG